LLGGELDLTGAQGRHDHRRPGAVRRRVVAYERPGESLEGAYVKVVAGQQSVPVQIAGAEHPSGGEVHVRTAAASKTGVDLVEQQLAVRGED
jgi:hypothetical protein